MKDVVFLLLRVGFGVVWLYAGFVKVADPQAFLDAVRSYQLVGDPWAAMVAMVLPWLEIFAGLAVVVGRFCYRGALVALGGLLAVFLVAILASWARGLDLTCGCFGGTGETSYPVLVVRDVVLMAWCAALAWGGRVRGGAVDEGG